MHCVKCNFELERVRRKKYQRLLFPSSKRYVCYGCNKTHIKLNLFDTILGLFNFK